MVIGSNAKHRSAGEARIREEVGQRKEEQKSVEDDAIHDFGPAVGVGSSPHRL